jgi:hypothetical protein
MGIMSIIFMTFAAPFLLPKRAGGLFRLVRDRTDELITELQVEESFPYIGKTVGEVLGYLNVRLSINDSEFHACCNAHAK